MAYKTRISLLFIPLHPHFTNLSLPFTVFVNFKIVYSSISHTLHISTCVPNSPVKLSYFCLQLQQTPNKCIVLSVYTSLSFPKISHQFLFHSPFPFPITVPLTLSPHFRVPFPSPHSRPLKSISSFPFSHSYLITPYSLLPIPLPHSYLPISHLVFFCSQSRSPIPLSFSSSYFSSPLSSLVPSPSPHFPFPTFFSYFSLFTNYFLVFSLQPQFPVSIPHLLLLISPLYSSPTLRSNILVSSTLYLLPHS